MTRPWMKFYPTDWRADPKLRMCSIGARGLWIEMLCLMHEAEPYGHLLISGRPVTTQQLATLAGISHKDCMRYLAELRANDVYSVDAERRVYSRRMVRDAEKEARDKQNGLAGGRPDIKRGTVPKEQRVRRFRRSDAPAKAQRIFDRSHGACHWCQKPLDPDGYHIDHVIAVRDGGNNDENNLVAACPDCNGERAMTWGRSDSDLMVGSDSDLMVGKNSDHKAQKPDTRKVGGGGDAGARPPESKSLISEEAYQVSGEILQAMGLDREHPLSVGAPMQCQAWLNGGWPAEVILVAIERVMANRRGEPPCTLKFFEKAIARQHAEMSRPLPVAIVQPQEVVHVVQAAVTGNPNKRETLTDVAVRHARDGTGFGPRPTGLREPESRPALRLLPEG